MIGEYARKRNVSKREDVIDTVIVSAALVFLLGLCWLALVAMGAQ